MSTKSVSKLKDLNLHPKNPRTITDEKRAMLRMSLDEFGDLSCICHNVRSDVIFGGNQRVKVLPPDADIIITQAYDPPSRCGTVAEGHVIIAGEKFKYRQVSWDPQKEAAGMLAANKHSGDWDEALLKDILIQLDEGDYDISLTGFDEKEVERQLTTTVKEHERKLSDSDIQAQYIISVHLQGERDMKALYEELQNRGYLCRLIT